VTPQTPSAQEVQQRLRDALRAAMKARDSVTVPALRTVLAAIANAEAVAAPEEQATVSGSRHVAGAASGLGAAEARRRDLTGAGIAAIIAAEIAERHRAARQYDSAGNAGRAARLRRAAEVIKSAAGL
jgi:uncharacterized protein YqeY